VCSSDLPVERLRTWLIVQKSRFLQRDLAPAKSLVQACQEAKTIADLP
jgi:hypothetical protein